MKITSFVIAILWLIPLSARAQPEFGLALKSGPNAATLAKSYRVNRYGFSGGIAGYLQWPLSSRFSLAGQVDLLYTPRGSEVIFDGQYIGRSRYRYSDITVVARPEVRFGPASVYLLLGGGLNFLLSATQEDASGMKRDITGLLNRVDVALLVGAGVALHLPRQKLGPFRLGTVFLEARHARGLVETDTIDGVSKNRASSLMIGVSFSLGSRDVAVPTVSPAR